MAWNWQQATTPRDRCVAVLKSVVWPAFLVYAAFRVLEGAAARDWLTAVLPAGVHRFRRDRLSVGESRRPSGTERRTACGAELERGTQRVADRYAREAAQTP